MSPKRAAIALSLAAGALVVWPVVGPLLGVSASGTALQAQLADSLRADSLNDGPHVYWKDASTAVLFHYCNERLAYGEFEVRNTLSFHGLCGDSATQYVIPARAPEIQPHVFDSVSKIFTVSDIHGEYEPLVDLLKAAGIIDEQLGWIWDDGHLVVNGDIFDRGAFVTECLWLLYRLEQEARSAGGRVHVLFGNHELMVFHRNVRYVNEKYLNGIVRATGVNYTDLFGPDMELGRWFRTKHAAIKLNDILFIHGGMPPRVAARGVSLEEINELAREVIDARSYTIYFNDDITNFVGDTDQGPFWYRGYVHPNGDGRYGMATAAQVDSILDTYDVKAVVVGHTGVPHVASLYEGKVFGVDVPLEIIGSFQGLLWKEDKFYRVLGDGTKEPL